MVVIRLVRRVIRVLVCADMANHSPRVKTHREFCYSGPSRFILEREKQRTILE